MERVTSKGKPPHHSWQNAIANYFQFDRYQINFRTEILVGVTTFMTIAEERRAGGIMLSDVIVIQKL